MTYKLGQICKDVKVSDINHAEFLSKTLYWSNGQVHLARPLDRVVKKHNYAKKEEILAWHQDAVAEAYFAEYSTKFPYYQIA